MGNVPVDVPQAQALREGETYSQFAGIATQIGLSIGETIASCIESRLGSGAGSSLAGAAGHTMSDPSLLNVVIRPEVKEPVSFKGDGHDIHTVQEWEGIMQSYLKKKGIPAEEHAEEVLCKLSGRAKEVVRVGLRSKPSLSLSGGPAPIFEILKQHFSDTISSEMPLADFYATLPNKAESPFDYWLRLNSAMDMAEDCLRRQNKTFDHLSRDLTAMFIRHCPDPGLSLIFKCKPLSQWSVTEVHERLVEHSRDSKRSSQMGLFTPISSQRREVGANSQRPASPAVSAPSPATRRADESADRLDHIITMLERVLEHQPHGSGVFGGGVGRARQNRGPKLKSNLPCVICGDGGHTTHFHCRANHLCFVCYSADHTRMECPRALVTKQVSTKPAAQIEEN